MKKKILSIALVAALFAIVTVGTLAYFTDTDNAMNTFVLGGVDIKLIEQQRGTYNGQPCLEPFEQNKVLLPIVGSAQGPVDNWGLPTATNYVDKIITVENVWETSIPAYVRVLIAVPSVLVDANENASNNILHWNHTPDSEAEGEWSDEVCLHTKFRINGIEYNIYSRTYESFLNPGGTTSTYAYCGLYLDPRVDTDETGYSFNGEHIDFDFSDGVTIPVYAQGIQAAGFDSAEAAFEASGLPTNPWA